MSNQWWTQAVRVSLNGSTAINVNSNEQAGELLLGDWPDKGSASHLRAQEAVLRSMERPTDPGTLYASQRAFEAAARNADILLPEPPRWARR